MPRLNLRDESRKQYTVSVLTDSDGLTDSQLQTGALLRIADATEKMAQRHTELIDERDRYKRWYNEQFQSIGKRDKTIASLRGQITKLKKRLAAPIDTHTTS
jgi:hypothetical protein